MKKFISIFSAVAVALLAVLSCAKEQEVHQPGEPEVAGCYGVFFPASQEAAGSHIYSPTQEKVITVTASRKVTTGAITVPVVVTASKEGVFDVGTLTFADGQSEANMEIKFPNAEAGVTYKLNLYIEDNQYAAKYADVNPSFDLSVMVVEMLTLKTEDGSKDAKVTVTVNNDFLGDFGYEEESWVLEGSIQYYEVGGVRYGSLVVPEEGGIWGSGAVINFAWYPKATYTYNDKDLQPVEIYLGYTGYDLDGSEVGEDHPCRVLFSDYYHHYTDLKGNDLGTYLDFVANYGQSYKLSYYDGHGGFYFNLVYDIEGTNYWYGFCDGSVVGIAEGYLRVDYTLKIQSDYCTDGVVPVFVEAGPDVKTLKYAAVEGQLNGAQFESTAAAIADGTFASINTVDMSEFVLDEETGHFNGSLDVELPKTNEYTLVFVGLDEKNVAQSAESIVVQYVARDDEEAHAVKVNVGTEKTSARYESEGYNDINSFAYWITGENLVDVHVGVVATSKLSDETLLSVKADDKAAVSADALAQINAAGGYVTLATGLAALTDYTVVVWATNGELDDWVTASYTTDGLPLEQIGVGTYVYDAWWSGEDPEQPICVDPNYENTFVLPNWGGGVDFRFVVNDKNEITIETFYIGADHSSYGPVYYVDPFNYYSEAGMAADPTRAEHGFFDPETGTYNFHFVLAVSAGSFGHFWETFTLNEEAAAAAAAISRKSVGTPKAGEQKQNFVLRKEITVERNPQAVEVKATVTNRPHHNTVSKTVEPANIF